MTKISWPGISQNNNNNNNNNNKKKQQQKKPIKQKNKKKKRAKNKTSLIAEILEQLKSVAANFQNTTNSISVIGVLSGIFSTQSNLFDGAFSKK